MWEGLRAAVGTCAQEKHLIASISCIHLVYSNGGEAVGSACTDHQGSPLQRVDGLVHERMSAHKVDHFIRVVLSGLHRGCEGSTRALQAEKERQSYAAQVGHVHPLAEKCLYCLFNIYLLLSKPFPACCLPHRSMLSLAMTLWQHLPERATPFPCPHPHPAVSFLSGCPSGLTALSCAVGPAASRSRHTQGMLSPSPDAVPTALGSACQPFNSNFIPEGSLPRPLQRPTSPCWHGAHSHIGHCIRSDHA